MTKRLQSLQIAAMFACGVIAILGAFGLAVACGMDGILGCGAVLLVSLAGFFTLAWRLT